MLHVNVVSWLALLVVLLANNANASVEPGMRLGDQDVARDRFVVYVMIGNSNMQGARGTPDREPHPRAWTWDFTKRRWAPAKAPLGKRPREGSPAMPFLKQMVERFPDHHFGVIKYADSLVSFYQPWETHFDELVRVVNDQRDHVTLGGVMTMFGANEVRKGMGTEEFVERLVSMAHGFRIAFDRPELPVFFTRPPRELSDKHNRIMATSIDQAIERIDHSAKIGNESEHLDLVHYHDEGYLLWAELAAELIQEQSLLPRPPALPDVPDAGERGTAVMITVCENMTANEAAVRDRLVRLGFGVRQVDERSGTPGHLEDAALVVVSADARERDTAQLVRRHATAPILSAHPYLARIGLGKERGFGAEPITQVIAPPEARLPWQGSTSISRRPFTPHVNPLPAGATGFARHPDTTDSWVAYGMDFDISDEDHDLPRSRRAHLGIGFDGAALFNEQGWALFDHVVEWLMMGDAVSEAPVQVPRNTTWPTNIDEVVVLWDGMQEGNRVRPVEGARQPLQVQPSGNTWPGRYGEMHMKRRSKIVIGAPAGEALAQAIAQMGELTLEIVFTPGEHISKGGWIFRWAERKDEAQLGLRQEGRWLLLQLGMKQQVKLGPVQSTRPHHVVVTLARSTGAIQAWIDGQPQHIIETIKPRRFEWQGSPLILGGREWSGTLSALALAHQAVTPEQAERHHALWAGRLDKRQDPPDIRIRAKLLEIPEIDEKPELYPNLLVEGLYEVEQVLEGELEAERIIVRHWATLHGQWMREYRQLREGDVVELDLSPLQANPQLEDEQVFNLDEFTLPVYYDPRPDDR
ncbi:MAG: sialate O-acetylesterase [Planctomycetota bacterium]